MSDPAARSPSSVRRSNRWDRLRLLYARRLAPHVPFHRALRGAWRAGGSAAVWARAVSAAMAGVRAGGYRGLADVTRVRWAAPRRIEHCSRWEFPVSRYQGRVIDGDWDVGGPVFDELDIVVALAAVMREGRAWQTTAFYRRILAEIEGGRIPWGCASAAELDARCRELGRLYDSIRTGGYLQRRQVPAPPPGTGLPPSDAEVGVSIGRDGDLLFSDGAHRLAIAKLLGLETMPVQVAVRHPRWFAVRREVLRLAQRHGGVLPQPARHPDLADLPARGDSDSLLGALRPRLPAPPATVLDWGAALGYACHRLEEEGFACAACEPDAAFARLLTALRRAERRRFAVLEADALPGWAGTPGGPRVLLALDAPARGAVAADLEQIRRRSGAGLAFFVLAPGQEPETRTRCERIAVLEDGRALWQTGQAPAGPASADSR